MMHNTPAKSESTTLADNLQPRSYQDLVDQADMLIQSRLCPDHFEDASDIVLVAQQGAELGVNVMTALQNSHVIHGNVGWDADFLKALCLKSGECERWSYEEKSSKKCRVIVKRRGHDPEDFEWTKKKAKHAGLWKSSPSWKSQPDVMLRHRVDAEAARSIFPDVVAGIHTPDELRNVDHSTATSQTVGEPEVVDETPVAPQTARDKLELAASAESDNGSSGGTETVDHQSPNVSAESAVDSRDDEMADATEDDLQDTRPPATRLMEVLTGEGFSESQTRLIADYCAYSRQGARWDGADDDTKQSIADQFEQAQNVKMSVGKSLYGALKKVLDENGQNIDRVAESQGYEEMLVLADQYHDYLPRTEQAAE